MLRLLLISVMGPDRPGIVDAVSEVVARHGGNWLESSMSRLSGQFAGVARVTVPAEHVGELTGELQHLSNLTVSVQPTGADDRAAWSSPQQHDESASAWRLELLGHDRPGIVHEVSHALAQRGVNVRELHTACFSAAMSGESMFEATAVLTLPADADAEDLRRRLESIAHQLALDLTLREAPADEDAS